MKAGVKRKLDSNEDRNDLAPATTETTETLFENTPLDFLNNGLKCGNGSKLAKLTTFTTLQRKLYARLFPVDPEDRSRPSLRESTQTQVGQSTQEETTAVNPVYINPEAPPDQRVEIDSIMAARLKEHQVEGVRFMWKQVVSRRSGCILAHSMGLGKTYQTITFVATLLREISNQNPNLPEYLKSKRILIVSPVIVLTNWVNEFSKWVPPGLESILGHVYNYADISNTYSKSKRLNYLQNWYYYGGILLMGYEAFRILDDWKDQVLHERVCQYLFDPGPALVIADEGHRIKSSSAKVTLSLRKIKTPARICLTGYPLQNNLQEYHCMINFVCQDFLPSEDVFKAQYRLPIEKDYQETARSDKIIAKRLLLTLQLLTSDIIQRRTQAVLQKELSPKTEYYIACSLSRTQYKIYLNVLQDLAEHDFDNIFYAVPILRSICNHPAAFQSMIERTFAAYRIAKDTSDGADITDINDFEDENAWQVFVSAIQTRLDKGMFSWTKEFFSALADRKDHHHSSKVEIASDIVKTSMQIGDKVVIVTHNIATLDYLQQMLPKVNNASVMRIDGQTPPQERQDIIDTFNREKDQHVMLLSARAGSLGVNITSANRIILMDADWNPSHEEQSLGRVYRYGQTKPVFAYRLYTASTIEDYLFKQGLQKRRLASRLIDNTQMPAQEKTGTKVALRYPRKKFPTLEQSVIDQIQDIVLQRVATEQRSAFVEISLADDVEYQVDINDPDLTEDDVRLIRSNVAAHKKKYYRRLRDSRSARM